jgi:leucine dehydrogenase
MKSKVGKMQGSDTLKIEDITDILAGKKSDSRFAANREYDRHEKIIFAEDASIGFRCFIAVHNTHRGPALGGCRYRPDYRDDADAITDVLRLSKGMTYKNATAGLDLGGGKCVMVGPASQAKPTEAMMRALGRTVDSLNGMYVTAEDMNTSEENMEAVFEETNYVCGIPFARFAASLLPAGFDTKTLPQANPSPYTAWGTYMGIKAAIQHRKGSDSLKGVTVAVKGAAGAVASDLCRMLHADGAKLIVSDWDGNAPAQARLQKLADLYDARITTSASIMTEEADVYAPCARGADLDDASIATLKATIIAGCANNVLAEPRHSEMLRAKGVLYAPDYVINAGGVICAGTQYLWRVHSDRYPIPTDKEIRSQVAQIKDVLLEIFARAERDGKDTASVADRIAEERFAVQKVSAAA